MVAVPSWIGVAGAGKTLDTSLPWREIRPTMTFTDLADELATEMPLPRAVTANRYRTDDRPTG
jgi:hypothetical protein